MITTEQLINEARTWVETPFHHNQMCKGVGADCIGVVAASALACGISLPNLPRAYPLRANGTLRPYLDKYLNRSHVMQPGDVLLMSFDNEPHHVALFCGHTIIHAYAQVRKCVEQEIDDYWRSKTCAIYRFKELDNG